MSAEIEDLEFLIFDLEEQIDEKDLEIYELKEQLKPTTIYCGACEHRAGVLERVQQICQEELAINDKVGGRCAGYKRILAVLDAD